MTILYEDNHIIVVVKDQNIPCCEDSSGDTDLLSEIKQYIKIKYSKPGNVYLGLVHRLDRPTGGIMVFAKTSKAASRLSMQIRNGNFDKKYLTIVCGTPECSAGTLTDYLVKDHENNIVRIVNQGTENAKKAVLHYRVLKRSGEYSLVEINLETGRSHQIRVQMAHIGTPVKGDVKYGRQKGRLCLFASSISFIHPTTSKKMTFTASPPDDSPWSLFKLT